MDFLVSPVSKHFPYSRDFVVSQTLLEKVVKLEGWMVGRLDGWKVEKSECWMVQGVLPFLLFPDPFRKGWKVRTFGFINIYNGEVSVCVQKSSFPSCRMCEAEN